MRGRGASCSRGPDAVGPGQLDQPLKPPGLRPCRRLSERCDPVVAAALVVQLGGGALAGLVDEALLQEALDGSVEGPRAQPQLPTGPGRHILDDGVAVPVLVREGERMWKVAGGSGRRSSVFTGWVYP